MDERIQKIKENIETFLMESMEHQNKKIDYILIDSEKNETYILASDGVFYEGRCKKLIIPAPDGEKGILANHENMVIAVNVGVAHMSLDGEEWKDIAVGVGFVEIVNNRVTLIVDTAEKPEDIDVRRAQEQKERAEERLRQQQSIQQYYHTQASLARAMNRLRVSQDKKWNL